MDGKLVEREGELAAIEEALAAVRAGRGGAILVEAPAGHGKTSLLRALQARAADAGLHVLAVTGAQLEREFDFGVVRQLLEPAVREADGERRARLFAGAGELARPVLEACDAAEEEPEPALSRLHGLHWVVANLAAERPLVVVVDDAHWADAASMRFVEVLARRVERLPVLLAVGARPSEPGAQQEALDNLLSAPSTRVLRPRPLTPAGIRTLLCATLGSAVEEPFATAAAEATAGNPLLVAELRRTLLEQGFSGAAGEAEELRRALPSSIGRVVLARLRRLSPAALALARSVALLGDGTRFDDAAELAGLDGDAATEAQRALARAGLFPPDELRFVHPVVREVVDADVTGADRARWRGDAARLRARAQAPAAELAAHLVQSEPVGEPWAARALARAADEALTAGVPDVAASRLRRALREPSDPQERAELLLALGQAEARAGAPDSLRHLEAAAAAGTAAIAVRADRMRAQALVLHGRAEEAAAVLRAALDRAADVGPEAAEDVEQDLLDVLAHQNPPPGEYRRRIAAAEAAGRPTPLSHLAFARAVDAAPAAEVLGLVLRARAQPRRPSQPHFMHYYALEALMLVEAASDAAAGLREARTLEQRLGGRVLAGPLSYMTSSWAAWERRFGDLREAEERARYGLDLMLAAGAPAVVVTQRAALAGILLDRGRDAEAAEQLALIPPVETGPGLKETHALRARLLEREGRHPEALLELERELELERGRGWAIGNREPSRETYVRVLLAVGRAQEARETARHQVELARRRGAAGHEARARVAHAATLEGDAALSELAAAAEAGRRSPVPLALAEALAAYGRALHRAGRRTDARATLAQARDVARRCGAGALEARAAGDLLVAGARPRRVALSGAESLTAAERRVAELAAEGMPNREIAETLFVTLKTVEVHLTRIYAKLGIRGRAQLAAALDAAKDPGHV